MTPLAKAARAQKGEQRVRLGQLRTATGARAGVRRSLAAILGATGAVLVGGVAQAVVWTWGIDWFTAVTNSQFLWALLCFVVAWGWALGRLVPGAVAGAVTGLALIASYYAFQWIVGGRDAAASQFMHSRGVAWTTACVVGGAAVGLLGALAGECAKTRPRRKAFGLIGAAIVTGAGPAVWLLVRGVYFPAGKGFAVAVFVSAGIALVATAVRICGVRGAIGGGIPAAILAGALLGCLFTLQSTGILYLTF